MQSGQLALVATGTSGLAWLARMTSGKMPTTRHQENIECFLSPQCSPSSSPTQPNLSSPLLNLLADLLTPAHSMQCTSEAATSSDNHDHFQLNWDAIDHDQLYFPSVHDEQLTTMASSLAAWLADGWDSNFSDEDGSNSPGVQDEDFEPGIRLIAFDGSSEPLQPGATWLPQHINAVPSSPTWFPWLDKQTCILDILWHLPHSLFSDAQLQVILWGLSILGVDNIPSTWVLKDVDNLLQSQYRIPSVCYQGALGHIYYVNYLPSIIAQEMANPSSRWLCKINPTIATPMICKAWQDFDVFELMKLMDSTMVIPECWYTKPAPQNSPPFDFEYWAHAWRAHPITSGHTCGYVIHMYDIVEVPASDLLLSFPHILQTYHVSNQPDPCNIIGRFDKGKRHGVLPWTLTDPTVGNGWHVQAQGHCVLSYMIWLYCDDTSGNMLKKWNKHNSFLFTATGLPRVIVHKESSIHFLAMSNIVLPLEMLDGIVDQLDHVQMYGIWAWDIEAREMVLVILAVLAMLSDNPMQSELVCHVGLQGKFFCCNCWVQGVGTDSGQPPQSTGRAVLTNLDDDTHSIETGSHATNSDGSLHWGVTCPLKGKGCQSETMQDLVDRVRHFLGVNTPCACQDTIDRLHSMFHEVASGKGKTWYMKMKMDSGIKDTYMDVFVEHILKHVKGIHAGMDRYTDTVSEITQGCPIEQFMSLVWRIKGLDPHQDILVEVLHVILLGFVKYFWHDAISRLTDTQKAELQVQLASFNISGLSIPPLAGQTLVQYAGSLTGHDFHAISQVAPFVLYDLIPCECFEAFLALSLLIPLIWQPSIVNIEKHLICTPQWFNKPKFHILCHLPNHIRCFGPAILFAMEGFELYNAVICDHSIHSNRQAPSWDIAHGMARCHHIHHLFDDECEWLVPGPGIKSLLSINTPSFWNVVTDYFGLSDTCLWPLEKTTAALRVPHALHHVECHLYQTCQSAVALNSETCQLGDFVLTQEPCAPSGTLPLIRCLHEILQICHSPAQQQNQASWLLLEIFQVTSLSDTYHLPRIQASGWALICCINVQHNCAGHRCTGSSAHCFPSDLILNTVQMHNAIHVQQFHTQIQQIECNWVIHTGTAAELNAQKIKQQKTSKLNPTPARQSTNLLH
ncbi:hypothetical protein EDD16DRAFT_1698021 [Pisolithus croceorrhizus]|nr:hypothetical protein EDD16DRAFT_1698021 [Pisolithus croceorrhizus]